MSQDFTFKHIKDLPIMEEKTEQTNVVVEENGETKRLPAEKLGKVKTVNNIQPDEDGNVEITFPKGFSGKWEDLTDKPYYSEYTDGEEILSTREYELKVYASEGACLSYLTSLDSGYALSIGNRYAVYFDGIRYECDAVQGNNSSLTVHLGNNAIHPNGEDTTDTGEPFKIGGISGDTTNDIYSSLEAGTHTLRIIKMNEVRHELDNDFMSEALGAVKSVNGNKPDDTGNVEIEIPEGFSGEWDDLKNKPFAYEVLTETIFDETLTFSSSADWPSNAVVAYVSESAINLKYQKQYRVTIDGVSYIVTSQQGEYGRPSVTYYVSADGVFSEYWFIEANGTIRVLGEIDSVHSVKIELYEERKKAISLNYLPDGYPGYKNIGDFTVFDDTITEWGDGQNYIYNYLKYSLKKPLKDGKHYSIFIDDVEYTSTAFYDDSNELCIGKGFKDTLTDDVPFCVNFSPSGGDNLQIRIELKAENTSHHIKIVEHDSEEFVYMSGDLLPKMEAIEDVTEAPTAEQFNALLAALRSAGYMEK